MPHHNCHSLERALAHAKDELNQIRTNININEQHLKTHPNDQAIKNLLQDLYAQAHRQEEKVSAAQGDLDICEAQNDQ